jgi:hypothetical protein
LMLILFIIGLLLNFISYKWMQEIVDRKNYTFKIKNNISDRNDFSLWSGSDYSRNNRELFIIIKTLLM